MTNEFLLSVNEKIFFDGAEAECVYVERKQDKKKRVIEWCRKWKVFSEKLYWKESFFHFVGIDEKHLSKLCKWKLVKVSDWN